MEDYKDLFPMFTGLLITITLMLIILGINDYVIAIKDYKFRYNI